MMRLTACLLGLVPVAATPRSLAQNCLKAATMATGQIAVMMGETPTLGTALTVTGAAGTPLLDGGTYTPGETLTVTVSGLGQYAFYSTDGSFGLAAPCAGKLSAGNAPGTLTTPIAGGPLVIAGARSAGGPGTNSPVTYERLALVSDGGTPIVGPPGAIGATPPPPPGGQQRNEYVSPDGSMKVEWVPQATSSLVTVTGRGAGWVGFALSADGSMLDGGANLALVGTPGLGGGGGVAAYLMGGKTAAAMTPVAVLPPECGVDLASATLSQLNGEVSMSFRLTVGGAAANCLVGGSSVRTLALPQNTPAQGVILARGATAAFDGHVGRVSASALSADGSGVGGRGVAVSSKKFAHGVIMSFAWVVLAPWGVYAARYEKGRPPEGLWFKWHRALLGAAVAMTLIATLIAITMVDGAHLHSTHSKCGCAFVLVLALQPLNAYYRPPKDAPKRAAWRRLHQVLGLGLSVSSVVVCLMGAALIGASMLVPLLLLVAASGGGIYRRVKSKADAVAGGAAPPRPPGVGPRQYSNLPDNWTAAVDPASGRPYYTDKLTGASQWEKPQKALAQVEVQPAPPPPPPPPPPGGLPADWEEVHDPSSGRSYYYNAATGETQWSFPAAAGPVVNRV